MTFADGARATADAVIGADGVHSLVRDMIVGPDAPIHKGRIAYRSNFPLPFRRAATSGFRERNGGVQTATS